MAQRKRPTTQSAISLTHPNAAGIDIGSAAHFVAVPPDGDDEPVREFASFTADLYRLADWLDAWGTWTPWPWSPPGSIGYPCTNCSNLAEFGA